MSEQDKSLVGSPDDDNVIPEKKDTVAYETYKRAIAQIKKLQESVKSFENEKQQLTEKQLTEQNEFKKLWEGEKVKSENALKALREKEEAINNGLKYQAFTTHLGGKLASDDYASFVPFDKIVINPETGKVDDDSAKMVAADFIKLHPKLVEFNGGKMPNHNNASATQIGSVDIDKMTARELEAYMLKLNKDGILKN